MSISTSAPAKGARLALAVGGVIAVLAGIAVLVWPTKAAVAITGVIAVYAIIAGIVYVVVGITAKTLGAGGRIGHVLLGVLYVIAGVYAFSALANTAAFLALFVTVMLGVMWIAEGFAALFTLGQSGSKVWSAVFAVISVVAGVGLLLTPLWGAVFLWWYFAASLIALGLLNIARALTGKLPATAPAEPAAKEADGVTV